MLDKVWNLIKGYGLNFKVSLYTFLAMTHVYGFFQVAKLDVH